MMKTYFLSLWPTNRCNQRCRYCFFGSSPIFEDGFKTEMMIEKVADAVIDEINSGRVEGVSFFGAEPLLNWKIVKRILARTSLPYIMKGKKRGSVYNITTNGTLLTPEIIDYLELHQVNINFSFDGGKETQDYWRSNSYDTIMEKLSLLTNYPSLNVLKTMANPHKLYEDVKAIRDLGFKSVFVNLLDPFSDFTYEKYDVEEFKRQYIAAVREFDGKDFQIADYHKWKSLITEKKKGIGCGFSNRGLGVAPNGDLYPCHEGPSLPPEFKIGDIFNGVDREKEQKIRNVPNAPLCEKCSYKFTKCYVTMWNKHKKFGVDAPEWHQRFEVARIQAIHELADIPLKGTFACVKPHIPDTVKPKQEEPRILIASLISEDKFYCLKPFLESLINLDHPLPADYVAVVDEDATRLHGLLQLWTVGKAFGLPDPRKRFNSIRIIRMPVVLHERFMWRIARGRNIVLGIAKANPAYEAYMFLDADMIVPSDTLTKLWSVDDGIVGALVKCRRDDREGWYNIYSKKDTGPGYHIIREFDAGKILYADATGSDCILIRRAVFDEQVYSYNPELPEAEDFNFCRLARERGFNVRIHTGIKTHHMLVGDMEVKK